MKKNVESRLAINKETVSNLEQDNVRGGALTQYPILCCSIVCTRACPTTSVNWQECRSQI